MFGTLDELRRVDFGAPLHCMALCSEIHPLEGEILGYFKVKPEELVIDPSASAASAVEEEGSDEESDL